VAGLDGLRGLAVLLVVAHHISGTVFPYSGAVGVQTFFVLSGFLITGILLKEHEQNGRIDFGAFYIRRLLRLYPALLVFLLLLPLVMLVASDPNIATYAERAGLAALYLSDFVMMAGGSMGILAQTWSLAVEEQFYLVWPAMLLGMLWLSRGDRSRLFRLVFGLFAVALAWRLFGHVTMEHQRLYFAPDTNFFAMLAGAALASVRRLPGLPRWVGWAAVAMLALLTVWRPFGMPYLVVMDWVATFTVMAATVAVWALSQGRLKVFEMAPLRWFGGISYGLYLWHAALLHLSVNGGELQSVERLAAVAVAVLVAWVSFRFIEKPILRVKERFERSSLRG
jgi:peptidoglycan/LPS O-acetylase OafA/YrhL